MTETLEVVFHVPVWAWLVLSVCLVVSAATNVWATYLQHQIDKRRRGLEGQRDGN